jgi:peptidoglycan-associated lipoprotein
MSKRHLSATILALSLVVVASGCKKKAPAPPPPPAPAPKAEAPPAPRPVISFSAEPATVERGQCATLRWNVENSTQVAINPGVGNVAASGTERVCPTSTTAYTLNATGPGGSESASATVNVTAPPPPPPPPAKAPSRSLSELLSEQLQDALFDYDKSEIREDARNVLTRNSEALKQIFSGMPDAVVNVEGHCDERGSAEYNLGLGDRRATAAMEFLTQLGVDSGKLKTVSYGKERPTCTETNENCYQRNRRAHFSAGQ